MNRLLFKVRRFHTPDPKNLQSISAKPFFKFYQKGITLSLQNNLQQANEQFTKSLAQIKISKQNELEHYSYILRRIAHNYRRLGQMKAAQDKLYEVIKHKRQCNVNPAIFYDDYDRLFRHMIQYDLDKAIKLCKVLLLKQKDQMPLAHVKLFNFNLANAFLLSGNYTDAKRRYEKCLEKDPLGKVKAYAYNNIGLAYWWQKNPVDTQRQAYQEGEIRNIQNQFNQAKQLFSRSVLVAETENKLSENDELMIRDTLDLKNGSMNENVQFQSGDSLFGLVNLAEFLIANDPLKKLQIIFWLKKALNLAKKTKNQKQFDRLFVQYCILSNSIKELQQNLPNLVDKYRYTQQFAQESYYCHVLSLILKQKDKKKSQEYTQRYNLIRSVLPAWSPKLKYLAMEQLDLTH